MATYNAYDTAMRYYRLRGGWYKPRIGRSAAWGHKLRINCYSLPAHRRFVVYSSFSQRFEWPTRAFHACV